MNAHSDTVTVPRGLAVISSVSPALFLPSERVAERFFDFFTSNILLRPSPLPFRQVDDEEIGAGHAVDLRKAQIHPLADFVKLPVAGGLQQFVQIFSDVRMQGLRFRGHDYPSVDQFVAVTVRRFEGEILLNRDGRR